MWDGVRPVGRYATLAMVLSVHALLIYALSRSAHRSVRPAKVDEFRSVLYLFEPPPPPAEPARDEPALRERPMPLPEEAFDESTAITVPSEQLIREADVDWVTERERVAREWAKREGEQKPGVVMGRTPEGMQATEKGAYPKRGDVHRLEGGVVHEWVNDHCYYTNEPPPGALLGPDYLTKVCKPGGGASQYQDFETWRDERRRLREEAR